MNVARKKINLTQKQKVLIHLLNAWGGDASNLTLQKLLFFFCRHEISCGSSPTFDFFPHLKGGYSFSAHLEKEKLVELGILSDDYKRWNLIESSDSITELNKASMVHIQYVLKKYGSFSESELVQEMYINYPIYAVRSVIAEQVLKDYPNILLKINHFRPIPSSIQLYTIGYEGISIEEYLMRLYEAGITILCDVRRVPFSHKKGFSKGKLSDLCHAIGLQYRHFPELGIASSRRGDLNVQKDYDKLFEEYNCFDLPQEQPTIDKLAALIKKGERLALTCFEADPLQCHRRLVAERIAQTLDCELKHLTNPSSISCQEMLAF